MNKKLLFAGSLRMMSRYKLRTFFMSLGVAIGVGTLVVARSLGTGAEQAMLDKVHRLFGPGSIMIAAGGAGGGPRTDSTPTLEIEDLEAIADRLDQIEAWDPMLAVGGRQLSYLGSHRQITIYGHSEHAEEVWNRGITHGRFFTASDSAAAARVALIGSRIAEDIFSDSDPIDEEILIDSVPFRVVGLLEPIGIDPHGMDRDMDIHVPTTTAMRRLLNVDYITGAKLIVGSPDAVEETAGHIDDILRERHGIAPGEPADFAIFTPKFVRRMIARANRVLKVFLPAAAAVTLLVAAIVISSIMLIVVRERIAEVGLRKAVGATEDQISFQFLAEAVGVTLASGFLGLILGAAVLAVIAQRMQLPARITTESIVLGLVAAVAVGILSGFLPARRAARLDPVEALR